MLLDKPGGLVRQFTSWFRATFLNRRAAIITMYLVYLLRTTVYSMILRGKWWNAVTTWYDRRKQLAAWYSSEHSSVVQGALYNVCKTRVNKRTLFEDDITTLLYNNKAAARQMIQASKLCSRELPFVTQHLDLTHPLLNTLLNKLSSLVAATHLECDASSGALEPIWYVFAVLGYSPSLGFNESEVSAATAAARDDATDETKTSLESKVAGSESSEPRSSRGAQVVRSTRVSSSSLSVNSYVDRRSTKLRVVVVREDVLQNLSEDHAAMECMVSERHRFRMDSLRRMKHMYAEQQDSKLTSVVDRIAGSMSRRHLMRVQIGYKRISQSPPTYLQSPSWRGIAQSSVYDDFNDENGQDSPAMFSPRRQ
jgi:hypothetical protein